MKTHAINTKLNFNRLIEKEITIQQEHGIHLRPAGYLLKLANLSPVDMYIQKNNVSTNLKSSILQIMILEILQGEKIKLKVDEKCPKALLKAIEDCLSAPTVKQSEKAMTDYIKKSNGFIKKLIRNIF